MIDINYDYLWAQFMDASINTITTIYLVLFIVGAIAALIINETDKDE